MAIQKRFLDLILLSVAGWAAVATSTAGDHAHIQLPLNPRDAAARIESDCADAAKKVGTVDFLAEQDKPGLLLLKATEYGLPTDFVDLITHKEGPLAGSYYESKSDTRLCKATDILDETTETILYPFACYDNGSPEIACTVTVTRHY